MYNSKLTEHPFLKNKSWWIILLSSVASAVIGGTTIYILLRSQPSQQNPSSASLSTNNYGNNAVSAQGRIEPQGKVIRLSASNSLGTIKIDKLLVKEGDRVTSNQVVAVLDQYHRLLAALKQAQQQVKVAQANLAKVKAGAKSGEINAQKAQVYRLQAQILGERRTQQANIARLQAQLSNAQTEFRRFQMLYKEGAVEASTFDSKRLELQTAREQLKEAKANLNQTEETLRQQINEAKATLNQIAEVRPTDVQAAQAEVKSAIAAVEKAQAELNLTYVRAPQDGQILKIYTYPGEIIGNEGIADMGQTDQMFVVAEVYETDVSRVRNGQQATITSEAFPGELHGTVTQVSLQVRRQAMFSTDPIADVDRRVVEVKIRLHPTDTKKVTGFTNLQVEVVINTNNHN
ncbi:MAG: ABC exporter membrane fusion protein [Mojavia pulchra JT2-VF2]|jgi:HlyD family secretion protein|uniref:ABC exporter membrane fusion protein n=1 Tax=Mojavia pulchra JT2-VF2 TaxID=287848 RepID=A0A951Q2E6_9NOST|nr:ABC exporter membrane fusion protein [Mojavia pulchra JT2-VF2]